MIIRTAQDIGFLIREARKRLGLTQGDLSRRMNTTVKWISHIENGKPTAEIGLVLQAMIALGVEMDFKLTMPSDNPSVNADESDEDEIPYKL